MLKKVIGTIIFALIWIWAGVLAALYMIGGRI